MPDFFLLDFAREYYVRPIFLRAHGFIIRKNLFSGKPYCPNRPSQNENGQRVRCPFFKRRRRGISVEPQTKQNLSPVGAVYSDDVAPNGA
jgi:hypothetical protein